MIPAFLRFAVLAWLGVACQLALPGTSLATPTVPGADPAATTAPAPERFGVLVMAHGGGPAWNRDVTEALAPVGADYPLEIAFGMADAGSLQDAVRKLEAKGATRIGVVRLFVSGESWYERTEQILGLRPGAPPRASAESDAHAHHGGHAMGFWKVESDAQFVMSGQGLADAPEMGAVLAERARALSRDPAAEEVLVIAHGPGDDDENARWLARIDARADEVRRTLPFARVQVETLREDWPEKRQAAEDRIRAFVQQASAQGRRVIVLPFRVQGFGPYAQVLDGLDYASDGVGLVPHPAVAAWVRRQAEALRLGTSGATAATSP